MHTGNTQAGNYISARSEILSAIGVVGAFLLYTRVPASRRWHLYLVPVVAGALAKNLAVMFAPLLLAYILLVERQLSLRQIVSRAHWPDVRRSLLFTAPAFLVSVATFALLEAMAPQGQTYGGGDRFQYAITQAWVWVRYVGLYFWPAGLTADSDLGLFATPNVRTLAGVLLLTASLALGWRASTSRDFRPAAFGIAWFWIALVPTSSIVPLAEATNDHRTFHAFIGLNFAVVWSLWVIVRRLVDARPAHARRILAGAAAFGMMVLAAHTAATVARNRVWRDDLTLWQDVAQKSPRNGRGLMNYGLALMRRGRLLEAHDTFLRARQLSPNYSFLEVNLGVVNHALGNQVVAERHFRRALELEPNVPVVHRHFARWLVQRGRGPEAVAHTRRLIELSAGDADARHALLAIYSAIGNRAALDSLARETLRLVSTDQTARVYADGGVVIGRVDVHSSDWYTIGLALTRANRHVEAAQSYREAIRVDSTNADAWNNLGWTLGKLGFYDAAVSALQKVVALRPDFALARNNLAWVRAEAARGAP